MLMGEAIVVSQFTLLADTRKATAHHLLTQPRRTIASPLVDYFIELLRNYGVNTQSGKFGAVMQVEIHNDGPVTILLDA